MIACALSNTSFSVSRVVGLRTTAIAPMFRHLCMRASTEITLTGTVPGSGIVLQQIEHGPAVHVGKLQVERDQLRQLIFDEAERCAGVGCNDRLKPAVMSELDQDARELRIVLDEKRDVIRRIEACAIVVRLRRHPQRDIVARRATAEASPSPAPGNLASATCAITAAASISRRS